jgi:ankyrin repeat protein
MTDSMSQKGLLIAVLVVAVAVASCASTPRMAANLGDLHRAVQAGDMSAIDAALKAQADIDLTDGHGRTALLHAAALPNVQVVEHLLDRGANPNFVGADGDTPLLVACRKANNLVAAALIRRSARVDTAGDDGLTCLAIAATMENRELFDRLLAHGARLEAPRTNSDSALIRSIPRQEPYFFERLMADGADPNRKGRAGNTPLIIATIANRTERVARLLSAGVRVNEANDAGMTALLFGSGIENLDPEIVQRLVEAGSDLNQAALNGLTPLKVACQSNLPALVVYLAERGAKTTFDDASSEDVEIKAKVSHILGDHFLGLDRPEKARAYYGTARDYYKKTAERYEGDVGRLEWMQTREIIGQALQQAAANMMIASVQSLQASAQSRQFAQIAAMQHATETRTGFQGYQSFMANYSRAYVPTYQVITAESVRPPPGNAPLSAKAVFAKEKARESRAQSDFISKVLECFDKSPLGGTALQGCVASLARLPKPATPK